MISCSRALDGLCFAVDTDTTADGRVSTRASFSVQRFGESLLWWLHHFLPTLHCRYLIGAGLSEHKAIGCLIIVDLSSQAAVPWITISSANTAVFWQCHDLENLGASVVTTCFLIEFWAIFKQSWRWTREGFGVHSLPLPFYASYLSFTTNSGTTEIPKL